MREVKKHWRGRNKDSICGTPWYAAKFAGNHKGVTCLRCKKLLRGYEK